MKRRILVIDDQPNLARMLRMMLEYSYDCEVQHAVQALHIDEAVRSFRPDLVLLDLGMPDRSGSDVATDLITNCGISADRIIFYSGLIAPDAPPIRLTPNGPMRFVSKTAPPLAILQAVGDALAANDSQSGIAA